MYALESLGIKDPKVKAHWYQFLICNPIDCNLHFPLVPDTIKEC